MAVKYGKKTGLKDYAIIGGVALAVVGGFLFFTEKGKALKDKIVNSFKKTK